MASPVPCRLELFAAKVGVLTSALVDVRKLQHRQILLFRGMLSRSTRDHLGKCWQFGLALR
jgi:hypothetical protein